MTPAPESMCPSRDQRSLRFCCGQRHFIELTRDDAVPIHMRGEFAAFTDPAATDLSISDATFSTTST